MKTIHSRGRNIEVPQDVNELTPQQFRYYVLLVLALTDGVITTERFRTRWLSFLLGLDELDYTSLKSEYVEEIAAQSDMVDGFFRDGKPDMCYTSNLLPKVDGFHGPGDWLNGVNFGEFTECLTVMAQAAMTDELEECYSHLARVLYHIPEDAPVPDILQFHAPMLFASVWHAITDGPIDINGSMIDFRIIFKPTDGGSRRADDRTGWAGITFEVASAGVFGTVKEVEATDFWQVLMYLYKCKFEYIHDKETLNKKQ